MDTATQYSKNDETFRQWKASFFGYLVQIGIPIFFYISGVGVTFYNTEKHGSFWRFLWVKFMRLIVPLIPAIFILHIPRHYISQGWDDIGRLDNKSRIENDFLKYVPEVLADNFLSKIGPLWFLLFIFQIMIMSYPLIRWTFRRRSLIPIDSVDY